MIFQGSTQESITVAIAAARQLALKRSKITGTGYDAKTENSIIKKMVAYASSQVIMFVEWHILSIGIDGSRKSILQRKGSGGGGHGD